jgi:hypothetical protein
VEIRLQDASALPEGDLVEQHRTESESDAAFHLRLDDVGIDRNAAIDRAPHAVDPRRAALANRHFGDLGNIGVEALVNRDAAFAATGHRTPQSAISATFRSTPAWRGASLSNVSRPSTASFPAFSRSSSITLSTTKAVCVCPTERHHSTGTPTCVL